MRLQRAQRPRSAAPSTSRTRKHESHFCAASSGQAATHAPGAPARPVGHNGPRVSERATIPARCERLGGCIAPREPPYALAHVREGHPLCLRFPAALWGAHGALPCTHGRRPLLDGRNGRACTGLGEGGRAPQGRGPAGACAASIPAPNVACSSPLARPDCRPLCSLAHRSGLGPRPGGDPVCPWGHPRPIRPAPRPSRARLGALKEHAQAPRGKPPRPHLVLARAPPPTRARRARAAAAPSDLGGRARAPGRARARAQGEARRGGATVWS